MPQPRTPRPSPIVWKALNDPLMTPQPHVIAAAIAALTIYALAELGCPHADTTIDTAGRQLRSDIDLWIGAVLAVSLVQRRAPSTDRQPR